ncbi:hypothetical protein RUND412_005082 [Rhizina undulata]
MFGLALRLLVTAVTAIVVAPVVRAAQLTEVTSFGTNPTGAQMFIYVPDNVKANPAVLVGVHWCHGTAQAFYNGTQYATLADEYGFIIIYPSAASSDGCWDVASSATLAHNGGGDSLAIANMVRYILTTYHADPTRVYATGHSSGGMMTNVLLGSYPDIFKAGSAFAGVPFGCFAGNTSWSTECATGLITKTAKGWGDLVRAAYPGYTGARPKMQLWHGTLDEVLYYHNFGEEVKQWTNVLGVGLRPSSTEENAFGYEGWVRNKYGDRVEGITETGQPHNLVIMAEEALKFFGIICEQD